MDKALEKELADLEAIIEALPNYLTRNELYTSLPRDGRSLPVSIGVAQDRLQALRQQAGAAPEVQTRLLGFEARLKALERLYPEEFRRKLDSEQRSRVNVARWQAEEAEEEQGKRRKK